MIMVGLMAKMDTRKERKRPPCGACGGEGRQRVDGNDAREHAQYVPCDPCGNTGKMQPAKPYRMPDDIAQFVIERRESPSVERAIERSVLRPWRAGNEGDSVSLTDKPTTKTA